MSDDTIPTPEASAPELTLKQEKFILAFIGEARGNASKAAIMAGYSPKSARKIGYELHKTPQIRARIKEYLDSYAASAELVLAEVTDIAMSEWRDHVEILDWDDEGRPLKVRMDLTAKVRSLEFLGKYHGLLTERKEISGPNGGPIPIQAIEVVLQDEVTDVTVEIVEGEA